MECGPRATQISKHDYIQIGINNKKTSHNIISLHIKLKRLIQSFTVDIHRRKKSNITSFKVIHTLLRIVGRTQSL